MSEGGSTFKAATLADLTAEDILLLSDEALIKLCDQEEPDWRDKAVALKIRINKMLAERGYHGTN